MYVPYRLNQRTFFIKRTTATKHIIYKYTQVVKQMEYKKKFIDLAQMVYHMDIISVLIFKR